MPCLVGRWPSSAFGNLGAENTFRFRGPLCMQRSVRLFLRDDLITSEQALSYDQGRIAVGIPVHLAVRAPHQRRSWGVPFSWFPSVVPRHRTLPPTPPPP